MLLFSLRGALFNGFSIFLWRFSRVFFKNLGKILHVHNAAMQGNSLHLQACGCQKMRRVLHSLFSDVFRNGFVGFFFKDRSKVALAHPLRSGNIGKR